MRLNGAAFPSVGTSIHQVCSSTENLDEVLNRMALAYTKIFSDAPYFETYSIREATDIFEYHLDHLLYCLIHDGQIVGFVSGHPLGGGDMLNAEKTAFILPYLANPTRTLYVSELGVLRSHRGKGMGSSLLAHLITNAAEAGYLQFCSRTALRGSNSRSLFLNVGATQLAHPQLLEGELDRMWFIGTVSTV